MKAELCVSDILSNCRWSGKWSFKWDDDALYLTSVGFRRGITFLQLRWVGILNTDFDIAPEEHDSIRKALFEEYVLSSKKIESSSRCKRRMGCSVEARVVIRCLDSLFDSPQIRFQPFSKSFLSPSFAFCVFCTVSGSTATLFSFPRR